MWWAAAASVISGVMGMRSGKKGEKAAKEAARENARLQRMETQEELRRMDRTEAFRQGEARALAGARGIRADTGSTRRVLDESAAEYTRQREWVAETGAQRANIAAKGGEGVGRAQQQQGASQIVSGILQGGNAWYQGNVGTA